MARRIRISEEQSQLEGRRKKRIHKYLAWSVNFINAWLEAGKTIHQVDGSVQKYDEIDVSAKELRYLRSQWMIVKKWRDAFCEEIKAVRELTRLGRSFYMDATADLELIKASVLIHGGTGMSHTDRLRCETYLLSALLHDFVVTERSGSKNLRTFSSTLDTLGNHIVPVDSPLVTVINRVYWELRDIININPAYPPSYYDLATYTEQEDFVSKPANRRSSESARKMYAWRWNTPKMERKAA